MDSGLVTTQNVYAMWCYWCCDFVFRLNMAVCSPQKWAHTQLVREHLVTVISAHWSTVDWSWLKSRISVHKLTSTLKNEKSADGELIVEILLKSFSWKSHHHHPPWIQSLADCSLSIMSSGCEALCGSCLRVVHAKGRVGWGWDWCGLFALWTVSSHN